MKAEYRTGQRKLLYDFFAAHPHQKFSVKEIAQALEHEAISLSAIYRNLGSMVKEGLIRRSIGGREAVYQYMDGESCRNAIHLTCLHCGQVFHMSSFSASSMQDNLEKTEGFAIDSSKTVLYGTCRSCKDK